MHRIERIKRAAHQSVQRACAFAALAIVTAASAFLTEPWKAAQTAAICTTGLAVILYVMARHAPHRDYRATELWILLGKRHDLPEDHAGRIVTGILADTFDHYAKVTAKLSAGLWLCSGVLIGLRAL